MPFNISAADLLATAEPFTPKPFFKGWNRLEGRVRVEDFERALRAEARDPLWFLARQWQFLELKGEDAGSPIEARIAMQQVDLALYAARNGAAEPFPIELPLEAVVERETPPLDRIAFIQVHRAMDKALMRAGQTPADRRAAHDAMRRAYPLGPDSFDGVDDEEARQLGALCDEHLFDVAPFLADPDVAGTVATASGLAGPSLGSLVAATGVVRDWYAGLYLLPTRPSDTAWAPSKLEYDFSCATPADATQTVLVGDGYAQGTLDWFSLDVAPSGVRLGEPGSAAPAIAEETLSFVPAAISFAGMPAHRFWQMEDRKIEFGAVSAHTTDIAKLLLTEFMLAYANDWCLFPLEVDIGALYDARGLVVRDVFGDATLIRKADRGPDEDWRRWALYTLETRTQGDIPEPRLFMPPSAPWTMEAPPIERVMFVRDEMANLCWAVEHIIPSAAGLGIEAAPFAQAETPLSPPAPAPAPGAAVRYELGSGVPPNWHPFLPVRMPGSIRSVRLQRARSVR